MSRKRREEEHVNHERWLVSYADFITLMFAFFVVLYASAQVDTKKMAAVAAAIAGGFQQMGVFSGNSPGPMRTESPGAKKLDTPGAIQISAVSKLNLAQLAEPAGPGSPNVNILKKEMEQILAQELKRNAVQIRLGPNGLVLSLREVGFFNSGEATLLPGAEPTLARIAKLLGDKGYEIRVEGHTDNVPIHNAKFRSNWELSTARATEVTSLLIERYHLDPLKVAAAGYSEYRPVTSNENDEGRRMNRRVDLVVVSKH
jgi:chemotaxis protein MotB